MNKHIFIIVFAFLSTACISDQGGKKHSDNFYTAISGWDIIYIPIFKPVRLSSVDRGETWLLGISDISSLSVYAFGVTKGIIYGLSDKQWFLFDVQSKLLATYNNKAELLDCLSGFNIIINPIENCNTYFDILSKDGKCYWYPKNGDKYEFSSGLEQKAIIPVNVIDSADSLPDFTISQRLEFHKNKIYFFQINSNLKNNELYYFSFNNSPPVLIKDKLIVPLFADGDQLNLGMYTPYPVAQEKGIPESKRFYRPKIFPILDKRP